MKKRSTKGKTDGQVLIDHIRELRTRLFVCAAVLIIGGVIGYIYYTPILDWLRSPLHANLYYSTPAGSFNFILKVSTMVGIFAAVPFIIFQLIMFIQPVFKAKLSTPRVVFYTLTSIVLAAAGGLFAFFAILPGALKFFAGFQVAGLSALIDANNYLNFVTNAIVTFIIVFQIPLIMVIIDRIKPISPKKLLSLEKYVVIGGLLVSLVVPFAMDITTSLLIASPIVILYNISVAAIVLRHAAAKRRRAKPMKIAPIVTNEMALDDRLIGEFFASQSQTVPALAYEPLPSSSLEQDIMLDQIVASTQPGAHTKLVQHASVKSTQVARTSSVAPRTVKPRPGQVDVEQLRAEARARREQEIAARVAAYNSPAFKIINDIR